MNAPLMTLDDLPRDSLRSRTVFVRVDFNVPLDGSTVRDATRLREALPTLRELRRSGARTVLASHLGRPKGSRVTALSLQPVASRLAEDLGEPVAFVADCVGPAVERAKTAVRDGGFLLLENLRFHAAEEANDDSFCEALSHGIDTYVGEAFGAAHRAHASTFGLPARISPRAAGRLMTREVTTLEKLLGEVERPYYAVIGGSKISGKIETLQKLVESVDGLLIGGGMANTFLAARGLDVGRSLVEADRLGTASALAARCSQRGIVLELPTDVVVAEDLNAPSGRICAVEEVPSGFMCLDIGPQTRQRFAERIAGARTLLWNGPMGVFEKAPFAAGSRSISAAVRDCGGFTVIGGGETVAAARLSGSLANIDHVSTGGGASLELLAGRLLPGVEILRAATKHTERSP